MKIQELENLNSWIIVAVIRGRGVQMGIRRYEFRCWKKIQNIELNLLFSARRADFFQKIDF